MKKYYLKANGKHVEVTKEVYEAYYQEYEHERYLINLSIKHESSLDMLRDSGYPIEGHLSNKIESVEESLIRDEMWSDIIKCLKLLSPDERELIIAHYLYDIQKVVLAKQKDTSKQYIGQKINRIIKKIREMKKI